MKTNFKAIATKTMIATAIASAMGVASAQWVNNPLTIEDSTKVTDATKLNADENNFFYLGDIASGSARYDQFFDNSGTDATFTQNLWVDGHYYGAAGQRKAQSHDRV